MKITRDEIIAAALRICGVLDPESKETANPTQLRNGTEALNLLLKHWVTSGLLSWGIEEAVFPLQRGYYTIQTPTTNKPFKLLSAHLRDENGLDIKMQIYSQNEYANQTNKSALGRPVAVHFKPRINSSEVVLYPTPDDETLERCKLLLSYEKPIGDITYGEQIPELPQEFYLALKWCLAEQLSAEYGLPIPKMQMILAMADKYKKQIEDASVPQESLYLKVTHRH